MTNKKREKLISKYQLQEQIPRHIGIIMDGNGRWAQNKHLPRIAGHRAGAESVRTIVRLCGELGVQALTLYAFSMENWRRPNQEVQFLMRLLKKYLRQELKELNRNNVRLKTIGKIQLLPNSVQQELHYATQQTAHNKGLTLVLALSYSARVDLIDAFKKIEAEVQKGTLRAETINEPTIQNFLSTAELPEVDLIIRTSGEMRVSNFLLWELAYAELYFTPTLWPDFREQELIQSIQAFQCRNRRFGGLKNVRGVQ
jgi:undecaprenyl diphosphate synthase